MPKINDLRKQFFSFISLIIFLFLSEGINSQTKKGVKINEICINNKIFLDGNENYSGWIEIYNSDENSIDISGYGLSNEGYIPFKWTFPKNTIIKPGEYLLVYNSKIKSTDRELHTNFVLNKNWNTLFFTNSNFDLIEKIEIPVLNDDETYGRTDDDNFQTMMPSPGKKNKRIIDPPAFSDISGFYESEFLLTLSSSEKAEIYFTTDGSDPLNSKTVLKYKEQIKIYDKSGEPNFYSEIGDDPQSPQFIGPLTGYKKPKYLLDKAMIVRAFCKNEEGQSKIISHSYFVTSGNLEQYKNNTVISIVTNPDNLFDPLKGIYVVGYEYIEEKKKLTESDTALFWKITEYCNYNKKGKEWEKEANIAIFEKGTLLVHQNLGIRIKGASTRSAAGKSFNLFSKDKYGKDHIKSTLFSNNYDKENKLINKYKSLSLRSVYDDERIRDEFVNKLIFNDEYHSIADSKKCILFLNGEYWGFYILMEKFSEDYFHSHYMIPKDDIVFSKEGEKTEENIKDIEEYNSIMEKYLKKDLTGKEIFNEINRYVDINSFIEYFVIGIYLGTWDWPNHNDGIWRNKGLKLKNNIYSDGRWRYFSYDFDFTMGKTYMDYGGLEGYQYDNFKHVGRSGKSIGFPTDLFIPLLKNEEFKNKFALRFCDFSNEVVNLDKVNSLVEDYKNNYLDMLANGQLRWKGFEDCSKLDELERIKFVYIDNFNNILTFFKERPKYAFEHMKRHLNLTGDIKELTIIKEGKGDIKINSIIPEFREGKWSGKYFTDIPITITAIPNGNSKFKNWSEDIISEETTISIKLNEIHKIKASFEELN